MSRTPALPKNEMILEVNGIKYEGFTDASFTRSLENFCGQFNFSTTIKNSDDNSIIQADIRCQDEVKVFIDDNKILTGYIEDLNISYNASSHFISVSGRDRTGDLIDSSIVKKSYNIRNFKRLVEVVLKDNEFTNVKVFDDVGNLDTLNYVPDNNSFITEESDTIISFLDRYAKKLQVLLTTDEDGDIRIVREGSEIALGSIASQIGNQDNNVLTANINISTTERFRYIEIQAQGDEYQDKNQLNQTANQQDLIIRPTRRKILTYNVAAQQVSLQELAKWNLNIRKAKGSRYNCRLQGFYERRIGGLPWKTNTLVQVIDDKCQLSGQFLIQGVTFTKSVNGTFTDLSIVNKGAFSVETAKQISYQSSGNLGDDLIRKA